MVGAIQQLQTYLGRPVTTFMSPQGLAPAIIALQTYLSTQAAAGQPSGFKWDPANVRKAIVDHSIPGAIIALQKAADLT
jgi:hypothetical protein